MRDDRDDVDDGDDGNQGDKARIVTRPTMAMMARLAYLARALVPVWDRDILDLERGARGYFRCCAIVSCRYYLSSGCAHPPLSCNWSLCATICTYLAVFYQSAALWLVRREPQMVHPRSHEFRSREDLFPPPPRRRRRRVRRNSHCEIRSAVDCSFGIRSPRAGTLGSGSSLCFCRACGHMLDSGFHDSSALPARALRSLLLPPGSPGLAIAASLASSSCMCTASLFELGG